MLKTLNDFVLKKWFLQEKNGKNEPPKGFGKKSGITP